MIVLIPINYSHYNFRKKKHLGKTSQLGKMSKAKKFGNFPVFFAR